MAKKPNRRPSHLRRELRRVENGATPSKWLIKKCWKDEEPKTLELRRKVFPNLCGPEPQAFSFANLNNLAKIYYNPRVVEQFKKASLFYKYLTEPEAER